MELHVLVRKEVGEDHSGVFLLGGVVTILLRSDREVADELSQDDCRSWLVAMTSGQRVWRLYMEEVGSLCSCLFELESHCDLHR